MKTSFANNCFILLIYFAETFGWSRKVRETLNTVFKLKDFRPQQLQTINCVLSKKDVLMIGNVNFLFDPILFQ